MRSRPRALARLLTLDRRAALVLSTLVVATTLDAGPARAADPSAPPAASVASSPPAPAAATAAPDPLETAEAILAAQPRDLVDRLMAEGVLVLQEVEEKGPLRGGIISSYVIFDQPVERVYRLLAQSERQAEFRPEMSSIETIEMGPRGPIDEQRIKILFQTYVFRIAYQLEPESRRIDWTLDERFDNDLAHVSGFWSLYAMSDGRTLGRSGTRVDVGPAVPAMLQDWITRKNVPTTMKHVRLWVNSNGSYRP